MNSKNMMKKLILWIVENEPFLTIGTLYCFRISVPSYNRNKDEEHNAARPTMKNTKNNIHHAAKVFMYTNR